MPTEHCLRARSAPADRRRDHNHDEIDDLGRQLRERAGSGIPQSPAREILPLTFEQRGSGEGA